MTVDEIYETAARWLVREQAGSMDWDGFTAWLEADPSHRLAYDELASIDRQLEDSSAWTVLPPSDAALAPDDWHAPTGPRSRRWSRWAGGGSALAAALALVVLLEPGHRQLPLREYRSPAGQMKEVRLEDGSEIVLAPASALTVQGDHLSLRGTGYFDVRHRPRQGLRITAGGFDVSDIGTRFSVSNEADGLRVEVAQGVVTVSSSQLERPIAVAAGHGLVADSSGTVRLVSLAPQQVGSWRTGRLQFNEAPLALVAREISRYSGKAVTVDPAIAQKQFSGVIAIDDGEAPARTLAEILSLDVRKVDGALRLEPRKS